MVLPASQHHHSVPLWRKSFSSRFYPAKARIKVTKGIVSGGGGGGSRLGKKGRPLIQGHGGRGREGEKGGKPVLLTQMETRKLAMRAFVICSRLGNMRLAGGRFDCLARDNQHWHHMRASLCLPLLPRAANRAVALFAWGRRSAGSAWAFNESSNHLVTPCGRLPKEHGKLSRTHRHLRRPAHCRQQSHIVVVEVRVSVAP